MFLVFTSVFLHWLSRFNQSLGLGLSKLVPDHEHQHAHFGSSVCKLGSDTGFDERMGTVKESAEMHTYLSQRDLKLPEAPAKLLGSFLRSIAHQNELDSVNTDFTLADAFKKTAEMPDDRGGTTVSGLMPRLSRFGWQRGGLSTNENEYCSLPLNNGERRRTRRTGGKCRGLGCRPFIVAYGAAMQRAPAGAQGSTQTSTNTNLWSAPKQLASRTRFETESEASLC